MAFYSLHSGFYPPPPPVPTAHIPAVRLKSEIPDRRMDPPQCVQNAMMTKDKKPFTYTPGGIDLSEIKSPRMARRIERNANYGGVSEVPKNPNTYQSVGPLPPSAMAVMQPQIQVQVLPGLPPAKNAAPPPPPPPPANIPPPPPLQPLPTQKVVAGNNQVVERPDMTKIIPDNPMALLKRTGGPNQCKPSFVDQMFASKSVKTPPVVPVRSPEFLPEQQRYQQSPPVQQQSTPEYTNTPTRYQPPVIERTPSINQNDIPVKTSTANLGSLYIPPANNNHNQQQQMQHSQHRVVSPPTPPERQQQDSPKIQSPGTPTLKEAPRPWQKSKAQQQQEQPAWAKRDEPVASVEQQVQNNFAQVQTAPSQQQGRPQVKPQQFQPQFQQPQQQFQQPQHQFQQPHQQFQQQPRSSPVTIEVRTKQVPAVGRPGGFQQQQPSAGYQNNGNDQGNHPNAVYITQPMVLQHPGPMAGPPKNLTNQPRVQQNVPARVNSPGGARVIPIQIERSNSGSKSPATPGSDRTLTRQQSWGNNPSQSNSFKLIQKITQTDDEEDEDQPITSHSPKYPQNFQQGSDRELVNRFKQDGEETFLHAETDPRYRGAAIPSKAFKLLQSMTDGPAAVPTFVTNKSAVPRSPQPGNRGPQVRTIPVQIEGDDQQQPYVHPSEQIIQEPKKYMGSSIPSRSFKILQAMTAPDTCANNINDKVENNVATRNERWNYDPNNYPPYPHPYCPDYYYYNQEKQTEPSNGANSSDNNSHNAQYWNYYPPYQYENTADESNTQMYPPMPYWGYGYPPYPQNTEEEATKESSTSDSNATTPNQPQGFEQYPPYFDPYYYYYYYGYPQMYPMYPNGETDDVNGYSSTDEMLYYNNKFAQNNAHPPFGNEDVATPTNRPESVAEIVVIEPSESDSEDSHESVKIAPNTLRSIPSVSNINVYKEDEDQESRCSGDEEDQLYDVESVTSTVEENDENDDSIYSIEDETCPHQLSVILEETERSDSRFLRAPSALSDATTVAESSEDETEEVSASISIKLPVKSHEVDEVMDFGTEIFASFTVKSPCVTPRSRSLCPENEENNNISSEENLNNENDKKSKEDDTFVDEVREVVTKVKKRHDTQESEDDWWGIISSDAKECVTEKLEQNDLDSKSFFAKDLPFNENKKEVESSEEKLENSSSTSSSDSKSVSKRQVFSTKDEENQNKVNLGKPHPSRNVNNKDNDKKKEETVETMSSKDRKNNDKEKEETVEIMSIKDRIQALKDSIANKQQKIKPPKEESPEKEEKISVKAKISAIEVTKSASPTTSEDSSEESDDEIEEVKVSVRDKISAIEINSEDTKNKSFSPQRKNSNENSEDVQKISVRDKISAIEDTKDNSRVKSSTAMSKDSSDESSDDNDEEEDEDYGEGDSGVTSDLSRHISDSEEMQELRKMNKYQRAATHSRLFQLLQEGCDNEDEEEAVMEEITKVKEDKFSKLSIRQRQESPQRREHLSLPLKHINEPSANSPINSPLVNEKLVNELVVCLLNSKKGQMFKNMSKEKLKSTALKVLQEDVDDLETPSSGYSSWLSPLRGSTESSSPAQTPQEFYGNYSDYYESWNDSDELDLTPSRAFKMLQEQSSNSPKSKTGFLPKCPRVLSSKNIKKELMALLDGSNSNSSSSKQSLEVAEVTSAS